MKIRTTKADKEFATRIKSLARWRCELCKRKYPEQIKKLDCAHFFGRRKAELRLDADNASALCFWCHKYLGENPSLHYWFQYRKIGVVRMLELELKFTSAAKTKFEKKILKGLIK